jgi:hypothetical protein
MRTSRATIESERNRYRMQESIEPHVLFLQPYVNASLKATYHLGYHSNLTLTVHVFFHALDFCLSISKLQAPSSNLPFLPCNL